MSGRVGLLFDETALVIQRRGVIRSVAVLLAAMQLSRPEIPKGEALRYASALNQMAQETKIDPLLAVAIVHFESRWYPSRVSEDGEDYGLGQVRARYLGPCRDDLDPVFAPSDACFAAKATLLEGVTNIKRMGSIIAANKTLCKEKAHSEKDPQWLAGYQGYNAPERNQWCKPGEKTAQVLAYHAELVEKFFPKKKAPPKSAPAKGTPVKAASKDAPAKAPAKAAPPAKAPAKPAGKVGAVAAKSPSGKTSGHRR